MTTGLNQAEVHPGTSQGRALSVWHPCSHALLYGVEKIGAVDGNQKNEALASLPAEQGQEGVHVHRVENCAKLIRMKAPAQTYVEGFLCRFFQVKLLAASHCLPSPICRDLTQESLISYSSFPTNQTELGVCGFLLEEHLLVGQPGGEVGSGFPAW